MMKYLNILLLSLIINLSCNSGTAKDKVGTVTISDGFVPPRIVPDTAPAIFVPSAFELRDDSVSDDGSRPSTWRDAGFTDIKGFKTFLKQVQLWVMNNDKGKLAGIIRYPINNIQDQGQFLDHYDTVFTKEVKLSFATINFSQIFRNASGAMTTGGKVWFAERDGEFKIIAINF